MFEEIRKFDTVLSRELLEELVLRISQRRTVASDAIQFLKNPFTSHSIATYMTVSDEKAVIKALKKFAKKFGGFAGIASENCDDSNVSDNVADNENLSFKQKLQKVIATENDMNITNSPPVSERCNVRSKKRLDTFDVELRNLKATGVRGEILNKTLKNLLKISPTSVDSERSFSLAGLFVTKIRSCLGHKSIFALTLLNSFFSKQKKNS